MFIDYEHYLNIISNKNHYKNNLVSSFITQSGLVDTSNTGNTERRRFLILFLITKFMNFYRKILLQSEYRYLCLQTIDTRFIVEHNIYPFKLIIFLLVKL